MEIRESSDFGFMSYLKMRGVEPSRIEQIHRGKIKAFYDIPTEKWFALKGEYHSSEFYKYEQIRTQFRNLSF